MANPIRNIIDGQQFSGILQIDIIEDDDSIVGVIRTELNDDCMVVHPFLYSPTKTKFKLFRKEFFRVMYKLKDEFDYDAIHSCTWNEKMVRLLFNGKAYPIGEHIRGVLYEYDMR
jgi:hypothetical protein